MAPEESMHGDRVVRAPPLALSHPSSAWSTVEEERLAALETFDGAFRVLQQSKYTPTKRESMKDVLGEVKINAARMGSNAEIYGFRNPFSVHTSAQLRTASMRFVNISHAELASKRPIVERLRSDVSTQSTASYREDVLNWVEVRTLRRQTTNQNARSLNHVQSELVMDTSVIQNQDTALRLLRPPQGWVICIHVGCKMG